MKKRAKTPEKSAEPSESSFDISTLSDRDFLVLKLHREIAELTADKKNLHEKVRHLLAALDTELYTLEEGLEQSHAELQKRKLRLKTAIDIAKDRAWGSNTMLTELVRRKQKGGVR